MLMLFRVAYMLQDHKKGVCKSNMAEASQNLRIEAEYLMIHMQQDGNKHWEIVLVAVVLHPAAAVCTSELK